MNSITGIISLVALATLYTPWKFIHVSVQFIFTLALGTVSKNNIMPQYEKGTLTEPSFQFTSTNEFFNGVIAISPMLLVAVFYYFASSYGALTFYIYQHSLLMALDLNVHDYVSGWKIVLGIYFLLAGIPSMDEIKKFGMAMISPAGFVFLVFCFIIAAAYLKNNGGL